MVTTTTLSSRRYPLIADAVITIGSSMWRRILHSAVCLLVLGLVTCLLSSTYNVGVIRWDAPEDEIASTASEQHIHLAVPHNRRSRGSSADKHRVVISCISHHLTLDDNLQILLHPDEQSVDLDRLLSNATPPVKTTLVFLC